jgi:colicin import membrane protein
MSQSTEDEQRRDPKEARRLAEETVTKLERKAGEERKRADEARGIAEKERKRADEAKRREVEERKRADHATENAAEEKRRRLEAEVELQELRERFKSLGKA